MAYIFLNDGAPEAEEYESNYLYFNESNTAVVAEIEKLLAIRKDDPSVTNKLVELCRKSFELHERRSNVFSALKTKVGSYVKKINRRFNNFKTPPKIRVRSALIH